MTSNSSNTPRLNQLQCIWLQNEKGDVEHYSLIDVAAL